MKNSLNEGLAELGVNFVHYDSNRNQETQMGQIDAAISQGAEYLLVNVADAGSAEISRQIVLFI